jgi:hypothetical protein
VEEIWTPDWFSPYGIDDLYTLSVGTKYWVSFYASVQFLTGGDVVPYGNTSTAYASFCLIGGALINAHILGNIAVIVATMNRKASKF